MLRFGLVKQLAWLALLAGIALAFLVLGLRSKPKPKVPSTPSATTRFEPRLVRSGRGVCWNTERNDWKCVDTIPELKAVAVPAGGRPEDRCIQQPSGVWRCSDLARKGYLGPDVPEPRVRENSFTSDMTGFDAATTVKAASWFACGILAGKVACSGDGSKGQLGRAPEKTFIEDWQRSAYTPTPLQVPGTAGAVQLASSLDGTCALMQPSGTVLCWGFDDPDSNHCFDSRGREKSPPPLPCQPRAPRTPPGLPSCTALSGSTLYAALSREGQVYTWVEDGRKRSAVAVADLSSMQYVAVESINQICAASRALVRCAWAPTPAALPLEDIRYGIDGWVHDFPELSGAVALAAISTGPCIRRADGSVWCSLNQQTVRVDTAL